jgi:hypothetical protein
MGDIRVFTSIAAAEAEMSWPQNVSHKTKGSCAHRRAGALARTLKRKLPQDLLASSEERKDRKATMKTFLQSLEYGQIVVANEVASAVGMDKHELATFRKEMKQWPIGIFEIRTTQGILFAKVV